MSRYSMFLRAVVCGVLALPAPLLARDYTTWALYNPRWYQPHYLTSVDEASNRLQFISPHFAPVTANEELTTGYSLQRVDVNRLGVNLSFTKSSVTQDSQYYWSWWGGYVAPVITSHTDDIVASIVYADVAYFELYHNGRGSYFPAIWCINPISRGASRGNAICVPSEADAHGLIDTLATLVVASGHSLDISPGMTMKPVPEKETRNHPELAGMQVKDMVWDSPPDVAGIKKGDILRSINGKPCTEEQAFTDLFNAAVREKPEGGIVHVEVLHKGNSRTVDLHYLNPDADIALLRQKSAGSARHPVGSVVAGPEANQAAPPAPEVSQAASSSTFRLGARVRAVTDSDVIAMGLLKPKGVVVTGVEKGGLAEEMQMQIGDVIVEVNGSEIGDVDFFTQFVRSGAAKSFRVWRKGQAVEL
ncbi:MAG: PDZ domain-containing protein, partial [Terracidiphilus sp.]